MEMEHRPVFFFFFFLLLSQMIQLSFEVDVDQSTFIARLKQLANDQLGINKFQQFIDDQRNLKATFSNSIPNGQTMAAQMANDVEQSIQSHISAVRRIQTAFNYSQPINQIQTDLCCDLPNLSYDPRFQGEIDVSNVCHLTRFDMSINSAVKKAMVDNLQQLPTIKMQYYGTEDGLQCMYPATNLCDESYEFDPRIRPWYTGTVNIPRDIVILVDRSTPMGELYSSGPSKSKLTVAQNAVVAILNYLNANDRVAVLGFSDTVTSANNSSCFGKELAVANDANIQQLLIFLQYGIFLDNSGTRARFEPALNSADSIFKASDTDAANTLFSDREKIVLMLTSGYPYEDCQQLSNMERQLFNNSVNIFIMEMSEVSTSQTDCLRDLTQGPYGAHGFVPNSDFKDLRGQLGFFYNAFIDKIDRTNVTFSIPYADVGGLGLETSICLPLFSINGELKGVTCIDLLVSEILSEIVNFRLNQLSYGFVIDKRGRVLLHPLLTPPTLWQDELPLLELKEVEISSYSFDVEKKIISGVPGNQTVTIKSFTPIGQSDLHGVTKSEKTATYFWSPIPSMKFFLCLVIVQNEVKSGLTWNVGLANVFLSDEMDLSLNGKCIFYNRLSINNTDTTVVKLAAKCFRSAESYLQRTLSADDLSQLKQYITWKGIQPQNFIVKDGIRDVVAITSVLNSYWLPGSTRDTKDSQMQQNIIAVYIGTPEGVYRRYPSIRIPKTFDPTTQPWYTTAVSQTGKFILTLPYVDYASQLPLISLSQTVFSRSSAQQHSPSDPIIGVMGMDVTVKYLYNMLTSSVAQCAARGQECFVIDLGGFIVIHKDFQSTISNQSLHITVREKAIAYELTKINVLSSDACVNYVDVQKQLFWKTIVPFGSCKPLSFCTICVLGSSDFSTNLFLIVKQSVSRSNGNCDCQNQTDGIQPCTYLSGGNACQCPCRLPVNYDSCLSNLNIDPSTWNACIPRRHAALDSDTMTSDEEETLIANASNLRPCLSCSVIADESLCEANKCCWLSSISACRPIEMCALETKIADVTTSLQIINAQNNSRTDQPDDKSRTVGLAIGLSIGFVFLASVVVVLLVCCYRRRQQLPRIKTYNGIYEERKAHVTTIIVKDEPMDDINNSSRQHSENNGTEASRNNDTISSFA